MTTKLKRLKEKQKQMEEQYQKLEAQIQKEQESIALYFGMKVAEKYPLSTKKSANELFKTFNKKMTESTQLSLSENTKKELYNIEAFLKDQLQKNPNNQTILHIYSCIEHIKKELNL